MATHAEWVEISTVVSGRVVNGDCSNDMILGVLYRASSALWSEVAGLGPVNNVKGIESYDLNDVVDGHLGYRSSLPKGNLIRVQIWCHRPLQTSQIRQMSVNYAFK